MCDTPPKRYLGTRKYVIHFSCQAEERLCKRTAKTPPKGTCTMTKQTNETPKPITLTNELGYQLINSSGERFLPTAIRVGATIKFDTIRNDGTIVTSTRFVTGGNNNHLTLKDYTGKPDGTLSVTQYTRDCITCWKGPYDPLHRGNHCPGDVHSDELEYINSRGVNFGKVHFIEVVNP